MTETIKVLALGGDGIGPEVVAASLRVLDAVAMDAGLAIDVQEDLLHGAAWEAHGTFIRDETLAAAKAADAVLVGAVGGPKWDAIKLPGGPEMQDGLMRLRYELDTFAGLRPAVAQPALADHVPFKPDVVEGADILVLREMCGGVYFARNRGIEEMPSGGRRGFDTTEYQEWEIERIARAGFELARRRRGRLLSTDKANVMESGVLWRKVVARVGAEEYPDVDLTHFYADNASYQLNRAPTAFDVVLGDNLFGDMLSDQVGAIAGSLGMLPSACLADVPKAGQRANPGIYEPVHGTAPDIAGQGIANPIGMILSVAMMFEYGLALPGPARQIEAAVSRALEQRIWTPDLGGSARTDEVTDAVLAALEELSQAA